MPSVNFVQNKSVVNSIVKNTSTTSPFLKNITIIALLALSLAVGYYLYTKFCKKGFKSAQPEEKVKNLVSYFEKNSSDTSQAHLDSARQIKNEASFVYAASEINKKASTPPSQPQPVKSAKDEADHIISALGERPLNSAILRMLMGKQQEVKDLVNAHFAAKEKQVQNRPAPKITEKPLSNRTLNQARIDYKPMDTKGSQWIKILNWVNSHICEYGLQVSKAKDFQDGTAFCALADIFVDGTFLEGSRVSQSEAKLNLAFGALSRAGVPKLLDAEDLILIADQKSIYTYLTEIYKKHAIDKLG